MTAHGGSGSNLTGLGAGGGGGGGFFDSPATGALGMGSSASRVSPSFGGGVGGLASIAGGVPLQPTTLFPTTAPQSSLSGLSNVGTAGGLLNGVSPPVNASLSTSNNNSASLFGSNLQNFASSSSANNASGGGAFNPFAM